MIGLDSECQNIITPTITMKISLTLTISAIISMPIIPIILTLALHTVITAVVMNKPN